MSNGRRFKAHERKRGPYDVDLPALAVVSSAPTSTVIDEPFVQLNAAANGLPDYEFVIVAGALPAGLTLNRYTGTVSGTPTTLGLFSYTVRVTDALGAIDTEVVSGQIVPPAPDFIPAPFGFVDLTAQPLSTYVVGAAIQITGINQVVPFTVTGDGAVQKNQIGPFVTSGTVVLGDTLTPALTTSPSEVTPSSLTLDVGGVTDTWTVTTQDRTPAPFSFVDVTGAQIGALVYGQGIQLTGFDETTFTVTGGFVELNSDGVLRTSGTVLPTDVIRPVVQSSPDYETAVSMSFIAGGVEDAFFTVTTVDESSAGLIGTPIGLLLSLTYSTGGSPPEPDPEGPGTGEPLGLLLALTKD